jgi:hypothetical protein
MAAASAATAVRSRTAAVAPAVARSS